MAQHLQSNVLCSRGFKKKKKDDQRIPIWNAAAAASSSKWEWEEKLNATEINNGGLDVSANWDRGHLGSNGPLLG